MDVDWQINLKQAVARAGWSQVELAERSGVPLDTVRKWFKANPPTPSLDSVIPVLDALGESFESVFLGRVPDDVAYKIAGDLIRHIEHDLQAYNAIRRSGRAHRVQLPGEDTGKVADNS